MIDPASRHPSQQELEDYICGRLPEPNALEIDSHLENCVDCQRYLDGLPNNEPIVDLIRSADVSSKLRITSDSSSRDETVELDLTEARSQSPAGVGSHFIGKRIGKYEVIDELGRGGMGVVYRAVDRELKREVALKVIISGEHSSVSMRERFRQEAETIARLKHSGIVQIYEVGECDQQPFLALELVDGANLADVIASGGPIDIDWAMSLVHKLAEAIHFAHSRSVIHRDLKPSNVLLPTTPDDSVSELVAGESDLFGVDESQVPQVKITDFGLAKQLDSDNQVTKTGHAIGTPAYMAPEQADGRGERIGPATDVYALGVILYELLTGRPPLQGPDTMGTLMAVLENEPESPRVNRSGISKDLETICLHCLMKDPRDRYATAKDLATDLNLCMANEPILARPPGALRRATRWARNNPLLTIAYMACAVMYALHLFAKNTLQIPFHITGMGLYTPWLMSFCIFGIAASHMVQNHFQRQEFSLHALVGVTVITISILFSMDKGAQSAPLPIFFVLIAASVLMIPKPTFVWFTTGMCSISLIGLVVHSHYISRPSEMDTEHTLAFLACLLLTGVTMHLIVRRSGIRRLPNSDSAGSTLGDGSRFGHS